MKYTSLFSFLFVTFFGFSQTSVISVKSHAGSAKEIAFAHDKFGELPYPLNQPKLMPPENNSFERELDFRNLEVIIKIDAHCVDRIFKNDHGDPIHDTVCGYWYYEEHNYNPRSLREFHGEKIILIGFDGPGPRTGMHPNRMGRSTRSSSEILFITLVLIALGSFIALPRLKTKQ